MQCFYNDANKKFADTTTQAKPTPNRENWFVSERIKFLNNSRQFKNKYFWRTLAQQEVDLIEDGDGALTAFECKWNQETKRKITRAFTNAYPHIIHPGNFERFLT